ncbi:MAG: ATP-binding protein [Betaproteobacteria bacterium]|nr:ATP-binding protein [Betaproteobacteria bacterium]
MAYPGVHPDANGNLARFPSAELLVAQGLAKIWYVSSAKIQSRADSNFYALILEPTDELKRRFNFTGDLACVLCPYERFDQRTIEVAQTILSQKSVRVDQNHVVIVARDNEVFRKVTEQNRAHSARQILVAFTYEELLGEKEQVVQRTVGRLSELLYVRPVFAYDSPLRHDEDLFGRESDIQLLHGKYSNGENGCLFGLRRVGKTSVLLALERRVEKNGGLVAYLDCSSPSAHLGRWNLLLYQIKKELCKKAGLSSSKLSSEGVYGSPQRAAAAFEEDLLALFNSKGKKRVLIILDEVESISFELSPSAHWADGGDYLLFWQALRSIYQRNAELLSIVVAGVNPRIVEQAQVGTGKDNPIFGSITPNYLSLFDGDRVAEMVNGIGKHIGLAFDVEVTGALAHDFGGHPFVIRQACHQIHLLLQEEGCQRPYKVQRFFYERHHTRILASVTTYLKSVIDVLKSKYKEEYELLCQLAAGNEVTFRDFALQSRQWTEHLKGYGLVVEDGGHYYFKIASIADLLSESESIQNTGTPLTVRWEQISSRRNSFESWLKGLAMTMLKARHGQKASDVVIPELQKASQKEKFEKLGFDKAWKVELYFLDLMRIVLANWDDFQSVFKGDKVRFQQCMGTVNSYRADAHAKEINDEEFAAVSAALLWLENRHKEFIGE